MIIDNVLKLFAGENTDFYEAALSYFCDKKQSMENKALMQEAFMAEVERKSQVAMDSFSDRNAWISHPSVRYCSFAILDAVINAIIPVTILPQFNIFADFRTQGAGDTTHFTIMPNSFYTVSLGNYVL